MGQKPTKEDVLQIGDSLKADARLSRLDAELKSVREKYKSALKQIEEYEKREEFVSHIERGKIYQWDEETKRNSGSQATAIVLLSDWHIEESVEGGKVTHLNEFSPKIAEARAKRIAWKVIEYLDRYCPMAKVLYLGLMGDFITGYIHEELRETNHMSPNEAVIYVQDLLCATIDLIAKKWSGKIVCVTVHGNHSRMTPKELIKSSAANSLEWKMYQDMTRLYSGNPKVMFLNTESDHNYVSIYGRLVRFLHGTGIKYNNGVGGFTIPANKMISKWNDSPLKADLTVFGHLHTHAVHKLLIANSSLIGHSEYGLRIGAAYEPPSQTFIVFSKNRGAHFAVKMYCDDKDPSTEEILGKMSVDHKAIKKRIVFDAKT